MDVLKYGRFAMPDLRLRGDLCLRGHDTLIF